MLRGGSQASSGFSLLAGFFFLIIFLLEAGREALNLGFFDPAHEENQAR